MANMNLVIFPILSLFFGSSSGADLCLTKENKNWNCEEAIEQGQGLDLDPGACQARCLEEEKCVIFGSKSTDSGHSCDLCSKGSIQETIEGSTSGICPKVVDENDVPKAEDTKFWCKKDSEDFDKDENLCKFPFKVNGIVHYTPYPHLGEEWCSVFPTSAKLVNHTYTEEDFLRDNEGNPATENGKYLVKSEPCPGDCRRKGHWWNGVGLKNPAGVSQYGKLTYTDCQELCRITEQCHFFHFRAHNKMCFLKSGNGFGHQVNNKGYLGHKLSKVCNGNEGPTLPPGSSNGPDDGEGNEAGNGSETAQSNNEGVTTAGETTEANTEGNTEGNPEGNT